MDGGDGDGSGFRNGPARVRLIDHTFYHSTMDRAEWVPAKGMEQATQALAYILEAVHLVADQGWRLLPRYGYEPETALWRHRDGLPRPPTSLTDLDFDGNDAEPPQTAPLSELGAYLAEAKRILAEEPESGEAAPDLGPAAEGLRWFPNPAEVES